MFLFYHFLCVSLFRREEDADFDLTDIILLSKSCDLMREKLDEYLRRTYVRRADSLALNPFFFVAWQVRAEVACYVTIVDGGDDGDVNVLRFRTYTNQPWDGWRTYRLWASVCADCAMRSTRPR